MKTDHKITLENVLKLRDDNTGDFEYFVAYLVPTVTNNRWSNRGNTMARNCFSTCATSTDESFAVLTFENNYDVWIYEYNQNEQTGQQIPGTTSVPLLPHKSVVYGDSPDRRLAAQAAGAPQDKAEQDNNKPKPKYTSVEECQGRRYQGWSEEGLDRFNQLDDQVQTDRVTNKHLDEKCLRDQRERVGSLGDGKRRADAIQDPKKFTRPRMNLAKALMYQRRWVVEVSAFYTKCIALFPEPSYLT